MTKYITAVRGSDLTLGHQGENNAITIRFNVNEWERIYGSGGTYTLINKRTVDPEGYPCVVYKEDNCVYWPVTNSDTQYKGKGKCELVYSIDDVVIKSEVWKTEVLEALSSSQEAPLPWKSWVDNINEKVNKVEMSTMMLQKLEDYLYYIELYDWDYNDGIEYYNTSCVSYRTCSSVRKGRYYGRNFDWFYDESATFVVRSKASNGRHASIGVAGGSMKLTKEMAETGEWNEMYKVLPFITLDGINDAGVACNINVVPSGDKGRTTGTNSEAEQSMCVMMIVRYVLDYAESAADAIDKISAINWYAIGTDGSTSASEVHFMVADADSTYIVEFVDNQMKVRSDNDDRYPGIQNAPIMTNFYLDGWDGNIVTGFDVDGGIDPEDTTLTPHAEGTERYQIIQDAYDGIESFDDMRNVMKDIIYTKAFDTEEDPFWYSELVGVTDTFGDLTIYHNADDFAGIKNVVLERFHNRIRNGLTWHTVHSTIIDMRDKAIYVYPQETDHRYGFGVTELGARIGYIADAGEIRYEDGIEYPEETVGSKINLLEEEVMKPVTANDVAYDNASEYNNGTVGKFIRGLDWDVDGIMLDMEEIYEDISDLETYCRITPEEYSISEWVRMTDETIEPYIYKAQVVSEYDIKEDTTVELVNNNAVLFAKYGFAIADVTGQVVTVYAIDEPDDTVILRVEYQR